MKERKWDEPLDDSKDFIDATAILPDVEVEDDVEVKHSAADSKARLTELRRRIEERLDAKRIALEFDYDDLDEFEEYDELPENLQ